MFGGNCNLFGLKQLKSRATVMTMMMKCYFFIRAFILSFFCQVGWRLSFSILFLLFFNSLYALKILVVVGTFPLICETVILNQITGLIDNGHDVYIYARRKGNIKKMQPDVNRYQLLNRVYYKAYPKNINTYDVILAQFGPRGTDFRKIKEKGFTGKLVTCFRGSDITRDVPKHIDRYQELFANGDLFLPVCDYFKEKLICYGCPEQKIVTHYSAIDLDHFVFKRKKLSEDGIIRIISVGRLVEKKGFAYLVNAIWLLVKKYPNIQCTIVGDGPLYSRLDRRIKKFKLTKHITVSGWVTHETLIELFEQSDIFVLPSVTARDGDKEGIPNTLKEAMAFGLPVISTYHAGIPELIEHHATGLLVPEKSADVLATAIEWLITHTGCWKSITHAARIRIETYFDAKKNSIQLSELLEQLYRM
ncbi:glycosyltransferase [Candidatus Dependentiae bacterium]|nr:glycosyltransferase [Candidatus Dependentiae bacterium]